MIRINKPALMQAVLKQIALRLNKVASLAVEYMVGQINMIPDSGSHSSTGASDWRADLQEAIKYKGINDGLHVLVNVGLIDADELTLNRGLLINYGMGKTLSRDNPYLEEYVSSEYYDQSRSGYKVYTRPDEEIYDYEYGSTYIGVTSPKVEIENFYQEPSEFFEVGMEAIKDDFWRILNSPLEGIDLSQFVYMR